MILTPAYGRDYKSKKEVQDALESNISFIINDPTSKWDGKPTNKSTLIEHGYHIVQVRYKKLRSTAMFKI